MLKVLPNEQRIPPPLASIEAVRPVFMIVMGVFLAIIAWRLAKDSTGWTARALVSGAFLLAIGYAVVIPLYDARLIPHNTPQAHAHGHGELAVAWHAVKLVTMNAGWLLFGLGFALHSGVLRAPKPAPHTNPLAPREPAQALPPHESIA